jgi:hypothetical protein
LTNPALAKRLRGRPERVFVSVNESTQRSTISFMPGDIGDPVLHENDSNGAIALREAKEISDSFPGCTVHGPHFHTAQPPGRKLRRRPSQPKE